VRESQDFRPIRLARAVYHRRKNAFVLKRRYDLRSIRLEPLVLQMVVGVAEPGPIHDSFSDSA
jgi:hypothetical protein